LSALLKEEVVSNDDESLRIVDIDKIKPGEYQPRKNFEYDKIKELADSIRNDGLLQPIIVKPTLDGNYEIIAGERRWRACKLAGYHEVSVVVKELNNAELLRISLIENIQREELSVIEEAEGFARLISEFGYTQEELAQILSKSRSHVSNLLRLNQLQDSIKDKLNSGMISMGHGRCLVGNPHAEDIAEYIVQNNLNVRQTEDLVKTGKKANILKFLQKLCCLTK
jgi:ParB family chromosome partitioning protein